MSGNPSSFCGGARTRYAVVNPDDSLPSDVTIQASQVIGLVNTTTAINFAPAITGATGGGAAKLDGVATLLLPTYYTVLIRETGLGLTGWVLEPDTDDATATRVVVPLDHAAGTNQRSWRQRL